MTAALHTDDPLLLLRRRWPIVVAVCALATLAALAYFVLAPRKFDASLAVIPAPKPTVPGAPVAEKALAAVGLGGMSEAVSSYRIAAILKSHSVSRAVVEQLDLRRKLEVQHVDDAEELLWKLCSATVDKQSELVTVTCESESPELARDLAKTIGAVGQQTFTRVSGTTAAERRRYLEKQVDDAKLESDRAATAVAQYQEAHHILEIEEQSKAVVGEIASLREQHIAKELQLAYVMSFAAAREASATQLRRELQIIDDKLRELIDDSPAPARTGLFPPALAIPKVRYELESLVRDQKIRETIYLALIQRLEIAKVDELQAASAFQILDDPRLPASYASPRATVLLLGAVAGLVLGVLIIVIPAWWRGLTARIRSEQTP